MDFQPLERSDAGPPAYRQIAGQIRRAVDDGALAPGERLPAIRDLASRLGVNRDTVASAYELLAGEGVVEAGVGRGTFVRGAGADEPRPLATDAASVGGAPVARPRSRCRSSSSSFRPGANGFCVSPGRGAHAWGRPDLQPLRAPCSQLHVSLSSSPSLCRC